MPDGRCKPSVLPKYLGVYTAQSVIYTSKGNANKRITHSILCTGMVELHTEKVVHLSVSSAEGSLCRCRLYSVHTITV